MEGTSGHTKEPNARDHSELSIQVLFTWITNDISIAIKDI